MYEFKTLGLLGKPHVGPFLWVCQICRTCAIGLFQAGRDNTLRSSHHRAAVLVAIAVPVFTTQLERSREATDLSNIRSAYAEATAEYLATGAKEAKTATANVQQKEEGWQMGADQAVLHTRVNGVESTYSITAKTSGTYTVVVAADGSVSVS